LLKPYSKYVQSLNSIHRTFPKFKLVFSKTESFDLRKIYLEPLSNIVNTQTRNFSKFKLLFLAAISSSTLCAVFSGFANYHGKTWFNIPRGQTPLPNPASTLSLLKPAVPLHQLSCHGSGHGDTSPQPLSLNAPSTAPESPLSTHLEPPSVLCSRRSTSLLPPQPPPAIALELLPPSTPPVPPSPAFKRRPKSLHRTRTTTLSLPDNLLSALAHPVELAGASHSPRPPPVPSKPGAPPTHCLIKVTKKSHRSRPAPSPSLPAAAGKPPAAVPLPGMRPLPSLSCWGRRPRTVGSWSNPTAERPPYPFGYYVAWQAGPAYQFHVFFFLRA
jgi:hypothetical protein